MVEWHVTPDYIVSNWTDELLHLMVGKLNERKHGEREAVEDHDTSGKASDTDLFNRMGVKVKHGN